MRDLGKSVVMLDGDQLREGVCSDLAFDDLSRLENIRRAAEIARLLSKQDLVVVCAFVTPRNFHRQMIRDILGSSAALIHVDCPVSVCMARDVKGLYEKARLGDITDMTGLQATFDVPEFCDWKIDTSCCGVDEAIARIIENIVAP